MEIRDDDLKKFEADGAAPLPVAEEQGYVENQGARIWYATYGSGAPVILLHGGLGNSGNWGNQLPALIANGFRVILIDSRGHGRSTRDARPYSYALMASDVLAVMDKLQLETSAFVGWSDGACTALVLTAQTPARVSGVFFFACNVDRSGVKPFAATPALDRCFNRHKKDYAQLSPAPDCFDNLMQDLAPMQQTQPNYFAEDLARIAVPVTVAHSEHDEFIRQEHAEYLAHALPNAHLVLLHGVSHFAPLQRPDLFNSAVLAFLAKTWIKI